MMPLFAAYPTLQERCPHLPLGEWPTPVQRLDKLGTALGIGQLYIKRDDLSGTVYGGNKVRKLEFILAEAQRQQKQEIVTFGRAGTNHGVATAVYARQLGMKTICLVLPQPNAQAVRRNLLLMQGQGVELHEYANVPQMGLATLGQWVRCRWRKGRWPLYLTAGGSSPLGTVGYVNAAFELKGQIAAGELPEPDEVYVAAGTLGTAVGLQLGFRAAGLKTRVTAVRIAENQYAGEKLMVWLFHKTNQFIHRMAPLFHRFAFTERDVTLHHDFYSGGYGVYTVAGVTAVNQMRDLEGIQLEGTYTGKTLAALRADAPQLSHKVVLFWNTFNGRDLTPLWQNVNYQQLPPAFHRYFTQDTQPLDKIW